MANYWDEEEKKRQQEQLQAQQQAQNAQNNQAVTQYAGLYKPSQTVQQTQQQLKQQQALKPQVYTPGQTVQQAQQMLQQQMQSKPGAYQSPHMQQVTQLYEQVMNRPQFKYNINADPLYQQYKNQYVQQGQRAMRDTVGTMAGLTGGYGNSYAQGAGQQEYQRYLGMLNAVMPELYGQAYAQYTQEGDELRNNLATAQQMDETEYGRYRDQMGDWQNQLNYLTGRYDTEAEREYGQHRDNVGDWQNQLNYLTGRYDTEADRDYGQYMDALGYRGDAYNLAIDMMARGMMPDAQTLAMAGLTADQAQAFMRSLTAGSGGGSRNTTGVANKATGMAQKAVADALGKMQLPEQTAQGITGLAGALMAGNTVANTAISQDVENKYGSMGKEYQITLADILQETEEDKKKKK